MQNKSILFMLALAGIAMIFNFAKAESLGGPLYYSGNSVGVGVPNPETALQVTGAMTLDNASTQGSNGFLETMILRSNYSSLGQNFPGLTFYSNWEGPGTPLAKARIYSYKDGITGGGLRFDVSKDTGGYNPPYKNGLTITSSGGVGINNPTPLAALHVIGGEPSGVTYFNGYSKFILESNDHVVLTIASPNNKVGQIAFADPEAPYAGAITYSHANDMMSFGTLYGTQFLNIDAYGNVGINTTEPHYRLDVAGKINTNGGLCINGICKTSWEEIAPAGSGNNSGSSNNNLDNSWNKNGEDVSLASSGNVTIGTTTASSTAEKLGVKGNVGVEGSFRVEGDVKVNSGNIVSPKDICIGRCN